MSDLDALVSANIGPIVGLLVIALAILAGALAVVARRARRVESQLASLTRGDDGENLADILEAHLDKVYAVARRQDELDGRAVALEARARHTLQGVSLVRFNNFDDTGGNQSFALAVANGVVISSLHARNQTRVYAKAVARGVAEGALSAEESSALREATTRAIGR